MQIPRAKSQVISSSEFAIRTNTLGSCEFLILSRSRVFVFDQRSNFGRSQKFLIRKDSIWSVKVEGRNQTKSKRMIGKQVVRLTAQSLIQIPKRTMYPQMSSNIVSGVPRNRIPFMEKVAAGLFIALGIVATPAYILTHLDDYRTLEKPE